MRKPLYFLRNSLFIKNIFITTVILLLAFLVLGGAFSFWSYINTKSDIKISLSRVENETISLLSAYTGVSGGNMDDAAVSSQLYTISKFSLKDILVLTPDGTVAAASDNSGVSLLVGKTVSADLCDKISASDTALFFETEIAGVYSEDRFVAAQRFSPGGTSPYIIIVSVKASDLHDTWKNFSGVFSLISVSCFFFVFTFSLVTTRRQADTLTTLSNAAQKLSHSDYTVIDELPAADKEDEFGILVNAFRTMAIELSRVDQKRTDLLANVAHELNSPMTSMTGYADGILDGTIPKEDEEHYLRVISSETKRLARLIRDLLTVSRNEECEVEMSRFNIGEMVRQTILKNEKRIVEKHLDVNPLIPEEPLMVLGNEDQLTQVVYNLLDNARKFAYEHTTINVGVWKKGDKAYVEIEDEGDTIPQEEIPLVFDRFHKVDKSRAKDRDGTGLGLFIAKSIIDKHNQDIWVESENGRTKFTFSISLSHQSGK